MKLSIRFILALVILGFLISCSRKSEKEKQKETLTLMKEGANLIGKAMQIEFSDSLKGKLYYRQALDKFLAALAIDTTQKKVGMYLPDLYSKLGMMDSARYWKSTLGLEYIPTSEDIYREKQSRIINLGREGSNFILKARSVKAKNSLEAKIYYRQALDKFLIVVALDSPRRRTANWVSGLYSKMGMHDSAKYWRNWVGKEYKDVLEY